MTTDLFPVPGVELTHLIVVADMPAARHFYAEVLGATVHREYGGTSCVLQFQGAWLLLVTGGGPTPDKPGITFAPPADPNIMSHQFDVARAGLSGGVSDPQDEGSSLPDAPAGPRRRDPLFLSRSGRQSARDQRNHLLTCK